MGKEYVMSIELPDGAKCVRTEVSEESVKVIYTVPENRTITKLSIEEAFIWVDFTSIKKSDYEAERKNAKQESLRQNILGAIENNRLKGLYVAILEPSVDNAGDICFVNGVYPAARCSPRWWDENATEFCPERKSRILSFNEYFMIVAHLIKNGDVTWKEAAEDSTMKGNFCNSPNSTHRLEKTGTRKCGEFYGFVGNTHKYVKYDNASWYMLMGGSCHRDGRDNPVADAKTVYHPSNKNCDSVAWLVLEK